MRSRRRYVLGALCAVALPLAIACGGTDDGDSAATPARPTQTQTARTPAATRTAAATPAVTTSAAPADTPAAVATRPSAATPGATTAPPPPPPPPPPPAGQALTFVGRDSTFMPRSGVASAGVPLTVTLDNQDVGVAHDLVLIAPSGAEAGRTEILTGPVVQSFTFTPSAGRYAFKCSVHPQTMTGTLTVQ